MSMDTLAVRNAQEIGERLLATFLCNAVASEPKLRVDILEWVSAERFASIFSPKELSFLDNPEPAECDVIQYSWYTEVTVVLGWAAGLVDDLPAPVQQSSLGHVVDLIPALGEPVKVFFEEIRPRSAEAIHEARDRLENIHARAISDYAHGRVIRGLTDAEVAKEHHRALNWLACIENAEWDQVPSDT